MPEPQSPQPHQRTDAVPVVAAELSSAVPRNLLQNLVWCIGTAVAVITIIVGWITIRDHSIAVEEKHDAQFAKKEEMDKHEREDIQAIKELNNSTNASIGKLTDSTNAAITKLTEAINTMSANAEVSRQWVRGSNLEVKALVTDQIARTCRKENANSKDPTICQNEIRAADNASRAAASQGETANTTTNAYQALKIAPPVISPSAIPSPTTGK